MAALPSPNLFVTPNVTASIPTTTSTGITGINSALTGINSALSNVIGNIPVTPQYFFTVPFPNNQPVLYRFRIYDDPTSISTFDEFVFPLTPVNITKQTINLSSYYDVKGDQTNFGVRRLIDQYGLTPPIITISGTTGFQFHNLDGYQWSGRSSFARLVQFIQIYATKVATISNSTQPAAMPILQFTEGYTGETYNVVPIGPQVYAMDVSRPVIQTYNLSFIAQATVTPQAVTLSQQDPIAQAFLQTKFILTGGFLSWWNNLLQGLPTGVIS